MGQYPKPQVVSVPFSVVLDRDEDGAYVVECPSLPGCFSQGESEAEALENITEAIQGCLEVRVQGCLEVRVQGGKMDAASVLEEVWDKERDAAYDDA